MAEPRVLIPGCLVQYGKTLARYAGQQVKDGRLFAILDTAHEKGIMVPRGDIRWQGDRFVYQPQDTTETVTA